MYIHEGTAEPQLPQVLPRIRHPVLPSEADWSLNRASAYRPRKEYGKGRTIQPQNEVGCIDDSIIDKFLPICNYLNNHSTLGVTLLTIGNLLLDGQLILSCVWWFLKVDNFRLPTGLTVIGVAKMLIAVRKHLMQALFQTREIPNTFQHSSPIPSILNSESFRHDYFFSAQCGFMLFATLEWFHMGNKRLGLFSALSCLCVCVLPLMLRQNYFMDVFTGLVAAHLVHRYINRYEMWLQRGLMAPCNFVMRRIK